MADSCFSEERQYRQKKKGKVQIKQFMRFLSEEFIFRIQGETLKCASAKPAALFDKDRKIYIPFTAEA